MDNLNRTHKVYGHVTEDEFYAGLNEAKKENILVDEKGWVDIGELIHEMWTAFADGRMVIVPKEGFHRPGYKAEAKECSNEECHCGHCEVQRDREKNRNSGGYATQEEFIEETPKVENSAMEFVEEVPKKPARKRTKPAEVKAAVEEATE